MWFNYILPRTWPILPSCWFSCTTHTIQNAKKTRGASEVGCASLMIPWALILLLVFLHHSHNTKSREDKKGFRGGMCIVSGTLGTSWGDAQSWECYSLPDQGASVGSHKVFFSWHPVGASLALKPFLGRGIWGAAAPVCMTTGKGTWKCMGGCECWHGKQEAYTEGKEAGIRQETLTTRGRSF